MNRALADQIEGKAKDGRCKGCDFCRGVGAVGGGGGWDFFGCYYPPYKGKWVCEIKDCPKKLEAERG